MDELVAYSGYDARSIDLMRHFRQLVAVAVPALLVAANVVGITLLLTSSKPSYKAVLTAQIDAQTPIWPGDAYLYQVSAPYLALATSDTVRGSIASKMGPGWDPGRVGNNIEVAIGKSPLLLDVSATAPDRAEAIKLATVSVESLDAASKAQRTAEVQRAVASREAELARTEKLLNEMPAEPDPSRPPDPARSALEGRMTAIGNEINAIRAAGVNGLSVLSAPPESSIPPTAPPKSIALFAGLVALLATAECLVWARGRFGRRLTYPAAERIAGMNGLRIEKQDPSLGSRMPALIEATVGKTLAEGQNVLFVVSAQAEGMVRNWLEDHEPSGRVKLKSITTSWARELGDSVGLVILVAGRNEKVRNKVVEAANTFVALKVPATMLLIPASAGFRSETNKVAPMSENNRNDDIAPKEPHDPDFLIRGSSSLEPTRTPDRGL